MYFVTTDGCTLASKGKKQYLVLFKRQYKLNKPAHSIKLPPPSPPPPISNALEISKPHLALQRMYSTNIRVFLHPDRKSAWVYGLFVRSKHLARELFVRFMEVLHFLSLIRFAGRMLQLIYVLKLILFGEI